MSQNCCSSGDNTMILACSGRSNLGQLSNRAAIELTDEGFGKMFCLAGIGGHISGFVQSAKDVPNIVVIDGCSMGCAKAILEHVEIPVRNYLVLDKLGIEKNNNSNLSKDDIRKVKSAVKETLQ